MNTGAFEVCAVIARSLPTVSEAPQKNPCNAAGNSKGYHELTRTMTRYQPAVRKSHLDQRQKRLVTSTHNDGKVQVNMYMVFEISRPFQLRPGIYRSDITFIRFWWLWFAISFHPGRYDEMIDLACSGVVKWMHPVVKDSAAASDEK